LRVHTSALINMLGLSRLEAFVSFRTSSTARAVTPPNDAIDARSARIGTTDCERQADG